MVLNHHNHLTILRLCPEKLKANDVYAKVNRKLFQTVLDYTYNK
jgi:hypothetical protein